jgi:hypothetical protein
MDACIKACAVCCNETIEEYNAHHQADLSSRSLTLANVLCYLLFCAHVYFAAIGKDLKLPYEFYAIILSPYGGAALKIAVNKWTNGKK